MTTRRFQGIWKEQCEAARSVREQHGVVSALDYLIGEKLMIFAETAISRPEFARELPRFIAEIRCTFGAKEIRIYLEHLERMQTLEDEELSDQTTEDDILIETPEQRAAARERMSRLHDLLTSTVLGTS
jgi:hypothetical protein